MIFKITWSFRESATPAVRPEELSILLSPEERERYVRWWRKFRLLENATWLGWVIVALGFLGFSCLRWKSLLAVLVGSGFLLGLGSTLWIWVLYCPRCGAMLFERKVYGLLLFFTPLWFRLCTKCGLSRRQLSDLAS